MCSVCAHPLLVNFDHKNQYQNTLCPACASNNYVFTHTTTLLPFNVQSKLMLYAVKNGHISLLKHLSYLLANKYQNKLKLNLLNNQPDLIIPIPIQEKRLYQRGYQQTLHMAKILSAVLHIPYANFIVSIPKLKLTNNIFYSKQRKQKMLNRFERYQGLLWHIDKNKQTYIQNKNILLVDDVMTTGATLNTLSELLLAQGCKSVQNIILARTSAV